MRSLFTLTFGVLVIFSVACSDSHQQADPNFTPNNNRVSFTTENSPVVLVDEAHHNFLTIKGRYQPFAEVLASDGYTVLPGTEKFSLDYLNDVDILVIANALDKNRRDWQPPFGNAFTRAEVVAVQQWVENGGALFLVADHTPFPAFVEALTAAFGFTFSNGHVREAIFRRSDNTLPIHPITQSRSENIIHSADLESYLMPLGEKAIAPDNAPHHITQIRTFGGSAFLPPENAVSLLTLDERAVSLIPTIPFQITSETPRQSMQGWSQGAVLEVGDGRVAMFAEGMMFSSQLDTKTGQTFGLMSDGAEQNERFLLNVMYWLTRPKR